MIFPRKGNVDLLKRIQKCQRETEKKILLESSDPHTLYLYNNNFGPSNPPSYKSGHRRAECAEPRPSSTQNITNWFVRQNQPGPSSAAANDEIDVNNPWVDEDVSDKDSDVNGSTVSGSLENDRDDNSDNEENDGHRSMDDESRVEDASEIAGQ